MSKIQPPKGMRDFPPEVAKKRHSFFSLLSESFESFGFLPLETPAMENLEVLTGKYGEEGDKLIFKVLNSGDFTKGVDPKAWEEKNHQALSPLISEKALRYDLTIPLARFIVQNQNEIIYPFKRYQIAPVWRADRPQKGRFREFIQCDGDIIGTDSLLSEVELLQIYEKVFTKLKLNNHIKITINHRMILAGIAEKIEASERLTELTICLDKIDKVGAEGVLKELNGRSFNSKQIEMLSALIKKPEDYNLQKIGDFIEETPSGKKGISDLKSIFEMVEASSLKTIEFNPLLARGLDYYTGTIVEVIPTSVKIGSLGGGGRYDNLTSLFGGKQVTGVGISFGIDRILLVLEEMGLDPFSELESTSILLCPGEELDSEKYKKYAQLAEEIRGQGHRVELYLNPGKLKKQLKYANQRFFHYALFDGKNDSLILKNLENGEQKDYRPKDLIG